MGSELLVCDPARLRLPKSRDQGADPTKLHRQIAKFGKAIEGMPPPWVARDGRGELQVIDGVTRATRVAKLMPGTLIEVLVTEEHPKKDFSQLPTVGDRLP